MTTAVFHPAPLQLLRLQSRGRRRRMWRRFCQPRRPILSALAAVLAIVWLGNAAMTIWLRETGSSASLRALLSLGLVAYAGWHFAKAAFFRPEHPFDGTPAERETLASMPLRPRDLVAYQLASVTLTTILKSGLFALLLWPDLRCLPLGWLGVLLAMLTLEVLRLAIDIAAWGMSRTAFLTYRAVTVALLVATGLAVGGVILRDGAADTQASVQQSPFQPLLDIVTRLDASAFGHLALPFRPLVDLILADHLTSATLGLAAASLAVIAALAIGVIRLYAATARCVSARERHSYCPNATAALAHTPDNPSTRAITISFRIPRWYGVGALAWRQFLGARRHWGSLLAAMIAPAILASAPCFVVAEPNLAFLATAGTVAFYTFLLLPTALRFDFRRDLDRLATLKALPISPAATVIGQTLAPVVIATAFQTAVLALAVAARSLPPHLLVLAVLVMLPLNVLVFGLDNLIYLLYPYRIQQEGLEIFLRTMLTFTGKGLLFTLGLVAISAWGFAAAALTHALSHWAGLDVPAQAIFVAGVLAGVSLLAALVLYATCRTYGSMNPIEDIPR